jgi:thiol-disulfide isomerase/thioredoxin
MRFSKKYFFYILLFYCGHSYAQSKNDSVFNVKFVSSVHLADVKAGKIIPLGNAIAADRPALFIFLSPECPLCQKYSLVLNKLYREYGKKVGFYGIIPGKTFDANTINRFSEKYKIAFPLYIDRTMKLSRYLQATATPEVILLDNRSELLYKGAIDDWFADLGKQRSGTTKNFLRDALDQQLGGEPVALKRTKAIGCYINDY